MKKDSGSEKDRGENDEEGESEEMETLQWFQKEIPPKRYK